MTLKSMFATSAAIVLALLFFAAHLSPVHAQNPLCGDLGGGLLQDCSMDNFYGNEGACSGVWKCSTISGVDLSQSEGWKKGPSVRFAGDAPFDRTIFQQVNVTPGHGYCFSSPFFVVAINPGHWQNGDPINRRVGIDPFGGNDPNSGAIKWSPDFFGKGRFDDDALKVCEYAQGPVITVFLRAINDVQGKHVDVYIDSPSLVENKDMPPIQVAAPTAPPAPTQPPPTVAPTREPTIKLEATDEPIPTEEPLPTDEPTLEPPPTVQTTSTPVPTRTRVALVQPSPRPTRVRLASAQTSSESDAAPSVGFEFGTLGVIGLMVISGAIVMVSAAAVLLLRRK